MSATWSGFAYTAFVVDVFSPRDRRLAGVRRPCAPTSPSTPWRWPSGPPERRLTGPRPPFRSGRAVPLHPLHRAAAEAGAVASVGSQGDSYDNALAETVNGLYKAELITLRGPWRTVEEVELATLTGSTGGTTRGSIGLRRHPSGRVRGRTLPDNRVAGSA